jgi:Domain of unknown function (DUF892)
METAWELFTHELGDMLDAEQKLVKGHGEQEEESTNPEMLKAFASHRGTVMKGGVIRAIFIRRVIGPNTLVQSEPNSLKARFDPRSRL